MMSDFVHFLIICWPSGIHWSITEKYEPGARLCDLKMVTRVVWGFLKRVSELISGKEQITTKISGLVRLTSSLGWDMIYRIIGYFLHQFKNTTLYLRNFRLIQGEVETPLIKRVEFFCDHISDFFFSRELIVTSSSCFCLCQLLSKPHNTRFIDSILNCEGGGIRDVMPTSK